MRGGMRNSIGAGLLAALLASTAIGLVGTGATIAAPAAASAATSDASAAKTAQPYLWSASKFTGGGISLAGFVPNEDERQVLLDGIGNLIADKMVTAGGEPDGFAAAAAASLDVLDDLDTGKVSFDGTTWRIEGAVGTAEKADAVKTTFDSSTLASVGASYQVSAPPSAKVAAIAAPDVTTAPAMNAATAPAAVSPSYKWSAEKDADGLVSFNGSVPTDKLKRFLLTEAGAKSLDNSSIAAGAPTDFNGGALNGLQALMKLQSGRLAFADGHWSLNGVAAATNGPASVRAALAEIDTHDWKFDIQIAPQAAAQATKSPAAATTTAPTTPPVALAAPAVAVPSPAPSSSAAMASAAPSPAVTPSPPAAPASAPTPSPSVSTAAAAPASTAPAAPKPTAENQAPAMMATPAAPPIPAPTAAATSTTPASTATTSAPAATPSPAPAAVAAPQVAATPPASANSSPPATPVASAPAAAPATAPAASPAPTPYTFAAIKGDDGATVLTGDVPTAQIKGYFGVVATGISTTGLNVVTGAPASFVGDALKGLDALDELTTGELHFDGTAWSIKGQAKTPKAQAAAKAAIASLADSGNWMAAIDGPPPLEVCQQSVAGFDTLNAVTFTSGAHLSQASGAALDTLATDLAQCPKARVDVEGNTDSDGDANANMALSVARAEAVVAELAKRGVDPDRLYAIGYGETVPLVPNTTAKNKALNRRIGIEVEDGKDK